MENKNIKLYIGNRTFTATLADNPSARALAEMLGNGDVTIEMEDYAGMEKVGPLGSSLPRSDENITTGPGDLILYLGRYFTIYYGHNSYKLTRLGRIDNVDGDELKAALGTGNVSVRLSLK